MKQTRQKGFTLIELLVVIAIIALLASIIIVATNGARVKAKDATRMADVKQFETAMEIYYSDNGGYPTSNNTSNGDVLLSDTILNGALVPTYMASMPALLITDNDHYYADGVTSGVSAGYDMLIFTSTGVCRAGVSPQNTGDWGVPTVCNF